MRELTGILPEPVKAGRANTHTHEHQTAVSPTAAICLRQFA